VVEVERMDVIFLALLYMVWEGRVLCVREGRPRRVSDKGF